jgi:large subunit ribosomal protein L4
LIVVENSITLPEEATPFFVRNVATAHGWDQKKGRVTLITRKADERLFQAAEKFQKHVKCIEFADVDVKDMLETGRIVIEKEALHRLLRENSTDLTQEDRVWSPSLDGKEILQLGRPRA